jgi:phosphoribosylanthranilate isomerase
VRVKICGVTTPEDARAVSMLGADAVGLNFHPPSPRFITNETARAIIDELRPFVEPVGVFVDRSSTDIANALRLVPHLSSMQLHGEGRDCDASPPRRVIAAFAVRGPETLAEIVAYVERCRQRGWQPRAILVDAHAPGQYGGTGQTAPWDLLAGFDPGVPLILAGGLTPDNIAEAIRRVRPYAVDVASGVESSPGRKDLDKVRRFIDNARSA